jgi:hypothetical protein
MRKLTTEEFVQKAKEVHGDKYDYSKVEYKNTREKVCIICKEAGHGEFYQTPNDHLSGSGCLKCSGKAKLTTEEFIKKAKEVHRDKYNYSKAVYENISTKVCIICKESGHGEFYQTPNSHLQGVGCPKCGESVRANSRTYTKNFFEKKAREIHGDEYNYSKVDYKSSRDKICIICSTHGEFYQSPSSHLQGKGCPMCGGTKKLTTENFIRRSRLIHGDLYDYSKVDYKNSATKVCIICPEHGEFYQIPNNHLQGVGCSKCNGGIKLDKGEFINKAKKVHGDQYDYSKVDYKNSKTPVEIFCKIHGYFCQIPAAHLQGRGCPTCGLGFSSDSKLSLLSDSDVEHLSVHQLIELIGQNLLPANFKVLTKSAAGSKDRKDDINKLRESIGSGTEENETAEEEQVLKKSLSKMVLRLESIQERLILWREIRLFLISPSISLTLS